MDMSVWEYIQHPDTPVGVMDLVFALYIFYGLIRGAFRGFADEVAGLLGTVLVFFGGWRFYRPVSDFMMEKTRIDNEQASRAVAYILMVFLFLVTWKLLTLLLRKLLNLSFPEQIQAPGGALLGGLKCAVVLCVILLAVRLVGHGFLDKHLLQESWYGRTTQQVVPHMLHEWFPGMFPEDAFAPPPLPENAQPENERSEDVRPETEEASRGSGDT